MFEAMLFHSTTYQSEALSLCALQEAVRNYQHRVNVLPSRVTQFFYLFHLCFCYILLDKRWQAVTCSLASVSD